LEDRTVPALVAAYGFEEGTGTTTADTSGNGLTGTLSNATWVNFGKYGKALSFNGTNAWVTISDAAGLNLTTGMTLEAWVKPVAGPTGWSAVLFKERPGDGNYSLYAADGAGGKPVTGIDVPGGGAMTSAGSPLPVNIWTHLAATYNGSTLVMYVNGVQAGSQAASGPISTASNPLRIGGDSLFGEYFNGLIDEVRIYNTALTQPQIQNDMNTPVVDNVPPTVMTSSPAAGATGVASSSDVNITFSEAMDPSTINTNTVELRDATNAVVPATVTYDTNLHVATLHPTATLAASASYTVLVHGGTTDPRVKDLASNPMTANATWSFTTAPLSVSISDASVTEGNSGSVNASFTVSLSAASSQPVSVTYATADGTATAGSDYVAVPPTVLTFNPGETSKTITVAVLGDTISEGNETFLVNLSNPVNAAIADGQGVGTIIDDDAILIGSEGYGYFAYTNPFEAIDLVPGAAGVTTIRATGDNNANLLTLAAGTSFNFYGTTYTSFYVSTNGLLTFGTSNTSGVNTNLLTAPAQRVIAPLWDDWVNVTGQAMLLDKYEDTNGDGKPDRLIIEWNNVQAVPSSPSPVTFQAILQLNTGTVPGQFTFNYPDLDAGNAASNGGSATVGIKDSGTQGARRLLVSFNSATSPYVASGKAITFKPDTTPPTVALTAPAQGSTVTGTVTLTASASDNVSVVGVQFFVDGTPLGAEDTTSPYSVTWDTSTAVGATHTITAQARDPMGNVTTSQVVTVSTPGNDPTLVGEWGAVMDWPLVDINSVLLKDGRILMWDGGPACIGSSSAIVWDPATNTFTPVPIPYAQADDIDIFCSAAVVLADGRVLVVGGHDCVGAYAGIAATNLFDPVTMTWTRGPDMAYRRWYPTATLLDDGRVLITAGSDLNNTSFITIPEVYDPVTNTITTLPAANRLVSNYPFVYSLGNDKVLLAGSDEGVLPTAILDVKTQTWTEIDPRYLDGGSSVTYAPGKFLKAGSSYLVLPTPLPNQLHTDDTVPAATTSYVLDLNKPGATWQQTGPLQTGRSNFNMTVLPDGTVFASGGSSDLNGSDPATAVYSTELWNPDTQTWSTMDSLSTPREYHSTAILLPDARVLMAGGGHNYVNNINFYSGEIFSPPYLFKGARPTISSAPTGDVDYGSGFFVGTPDAADIASVVLVRGGAATHFFDMEQRRVPLSFTQTAGGLTVQAPADAGLAPPGYYMLFILNSAGVPSIAQFIRLPAAYEDHQPPTAPTNLAGAGGIGTATLTWTAATDNVGVVAYNVYRSTTPNFAPSAANLVGQSTTTTFLSTGMTAGTYYFQVIARDAAGNVSNPSNQASANVVADTNPPTVSVTGPTAGSSVSGVVTVSAVASDDVGVAGVQFFVDGNAIGEEDTTAPYSVSWGTPLSGNGTHTLTARARDTGGNFTTSAGVQVTVNNAVPNGLVLALGFEEGVGTTTADVSGHGNNGTISGAVWADHGQFGKALSFNGSSSWVTVADSASLDLTTGMTLEAWVDPTSVTGWTSVLFKERPGDGNYSLYAAEGAGTPPVSGVDVPGGALVVGGTPVPLGSWTHLASTYDGSMVRLYVNGILVGTKAASGPISTSSDPLRIGGDSLFGEYFTGLIDEVRVYNRALSAAEIQTDMITPVGGGSPQLAAGGAVPGGSVPVLTPAELAPVVAEAARRWEAAGLNPNQIAALGRTQFQITDLGTTGELGQTAIGGSLVRLDDDGAGRGWFVDPTPADDTEFGLRVTPTEFRAEAGSAAGEYDLLTVVMHELGHVIGFDDLDPAAVPHDLFTATLPTGTRRLPTAGVGGTPTTPGSLPIPVGDAESGLPATPVPTAPTKLAPAAPPVVVTTPSMPPGLGVEAISLLSVPSNGSQAGDPRPGAEAGQDAAAPPTRAQLPLLVEQSWQLPADGRLDPARWVAGSEPESSDWALFDGVRLD
jgi:hypothetical protein